MSCVDRPAHVKAALESARARGCKTEPFRCVNAKGRQREVPLKHLVNDTLCVFYDAGTDRRVQMTRTTVSGSRDVVIRAIIANRNHFFVVPSSVLLEHYPEGGSFYARISKRPRDESSKGPDPSLDFWPYENEWPQPSVQRNKLKRAA